MTETGTCDAEALSQVKMYCAGVPRSRYTWGKSPYPGGRGGLGGWLRTATKARARSPFFWPAAPSLTSEVAATTLQMDGKPWTEALGDPASGKLGVWPRFGRIAQLCSPSFVVYDGEKAGWSWVVTQLFAQPR